MNSGWGVLVLVTASVFFCSASAPARQPAWSASGGALPTNGQNADAWHFELTPYLWASGIDGELGARGHTVQVDVGFSDILENLDFAFLLAGGARRGEWGAGFEVIYLNLSAHRATPGPLFTEARFEIDQLTFELTGRFRILPPAPAALDLLFGGRFWRLENTLDLTDGVAAAVRRSARESWFDPIVGLSTVMDVYPRWLIQARGDIGGFNVGSDLTWQVLGLIGYRFNDTWSLKAGYRHLDIDFTDDGFTFDVGIGGFITGVTLVF